MKIIYMGTPDFAVAPLAALAENGYEVEAVITQPDKPKGRGKTMMPTPVKEEALKHGIPVLQPVKVRDPEFVEELKNLAPDIIIVAAFGQIIPKSILDMPRFGCINIHASLLPKYRGAAPIQQAVIDGEKESGVTIMQMGTGLDTGDMISRIVVPLAKDETGGSLFDKLAQAGAELLVQTLPSIFDGTATREKQPEESPTPYAAMISKKMGLLDFSKNAEELERLVRGLDPWPSAFTFINGKTLKVWKSSVLEKQAQEAPGTVIAADKGGIQVACGAAGRQKTHGSGCVPPGISVETRRHVQRFQGVMSYVRIWLLRMGNGPHDSFTCDRNASFSCGIRKAAQYLCSL